VGAPGALSGISERAPRAEPFDLEVTLAEEGNGNVKISDIGGSKETGEERKSALQEHPRSEPAPVGKPGIPEKTEEDPLAAAQREVEANRDRWVRAVADLENFKKRSVQEKTRLLKYRHEDLLRDLLPVLDNLDRALSHCNAAGRADTLSEGVCLVANMLKEVLARYQVKEIKALGEPFDPHVHEAIARVSAPADQANLVVDELEKGYMYEDRLLRPAKVVVAAAEGA
jgi:molecular chaperone GrpE